MQVRVLQVRSIAGTSTPGKGVPVEVVFTMKSRGRSRVFDPAFAMLRFDGVSIPPLDMTDSGRTAVIPRALPAEIAVAATLVYAVPRGSRYATLTVQPSDVTPSRAGTVRIELPIQVRAR